MAKSQINRYLRARLTRPAQRRSQGGYRPAEAVLFYEHFHMMGFIGLSKISVKVLPQEPDAPTCHAAARTGKICMSISTRGRAGGGH
jgi:hypothetical protein